MKEPGWRRDESKEGDKNDCERGETERTEVEEADKGKEDKFEEKLVQKVKKQNRGQRTLRGWLCDDRLGSPKNGERARSQLRSYIVSPQLGQ